MFFYLSFFWFIRETRACLFWLYLWQLKEYHIGRFLDHFGTEKGKKLFFNKLVILKTALFFYALFLTLPQKTLPWFFYAAWIGILIILYFFESIKTLFDFLRKRLKKPVLTKKASVLVLVIITFEIFFIFLLFQNIKLLYWSSLFFLVFDILTPLLVSIIVLLFQPLTVLLRNRIIKKAKIKREKFKELIVIGITGSYGKTSTKEILAAILAEKYNVLKTEKHQNSEIAIASCILNDLKPEHQIFICEVGAYNKGKIKEVCQFLKPKIGILTGINEQHLSTFGSQENIIKGKYELIESLPEEGLSIFNGNNQYCLELYKNTQTPKKIITIKPYSHIAIEPDVWAENIIVEKEFISFKVFSKDHNPPGASPQPPDGGWAPGDSADFKVNLLGSQNIENILLATEAAKELGMSLKEISRACQKLKPPPHQMELKKTVRGLNILDATYSANPDGVISHLEYLKIWPGKKIIIMPCLIELGKVSKEIHKKIGKKIGEICDVAIITTRERFKEIKKGAMETKIYKENILISSEARNQGSEERSDEWFLFLENPKEIFKKIKEFCQSDDIVLLEGRLPNQLVNLLTSP